MKFSGKIGNGLMNKWLNFGGDTDTDMDPDLDRNTGETCLDRGVHCPSASSCCMFFQAVCRSCHLNQQCQNTERNLEH